MDSTFFATCPRATEDLLAAEIANCGAVEHRLVPGGVFFRGSLECAYRLCLWSRIAGRVFLEVARDRAEDPETLYRLTKSVDWPSHFDVDSTFSVSFDSPGRHFPNKDFAALRIKDAVADSFRDAVGRRPSVHRIDPAVALHGVAENDSTRLFICLSGPSLHRRSYRVQGGEAPLKENAAAAVLLRARWPEIAAGGGALIDPLCGTGTIVIEAALMAADFAPGLLRKRYGFLRWKKHEPKIWDELRAEAEKRFSFDKLPPLYASDSDARAVSAAKANADAAGLSGKILFSVKPFKQSTVPAPVRARGGLVATNPPYGVRLADSALAGLYRSLGEHLMAEFAGWKAVVLTVSRELGLQIPIRATHVNSLYNGSLACVVLHFELTNERVFRSRIHVAGRDVDPADVRRDIEDEMAEHRNLDPENLSSGALMLYHRLKKNRRMLKSWIKSSGVSCYRIYDADMPEYNVAIDIYENHHAVVQEYAPPSTINEAAARRRLDEALTAIPPALELDRAEIVVKQRKKQTRTLQYEKKEDESELLPVSENGLKFLVNLSEYIDTGLFLDSRPVREKIRSLTRDRAFLNLFSYTGTATVYAAAGGARRTVSVDASATYLAWAERNLELNGFTGDQHRLERSDVMEWLGKATERFDVVLVDPPTYSNSHSREKDFDLLKDYPGLIGRCLQIMNSGGILIFSTHFRKFRMDTSLLPGIAIKDLSEETIPPDFRRNPRIRQTWLISRTTF